MKKLLILLAVLFAGSAQAATTNSLDGAVALVTQGGTGGTTGARQLLTSTTNFYVATTGSDSNNCSSGAKCLTIGHALAYVQANYDLGGQTVNINVADGTYTTAVSLSAPFIGGVPNLIGDVTTPTNCAITVTSNPAFLLIGGVQINMKGFSISTVTSGSGIVVGTGSVVTLVGNMNFGAASGGQYQMVASGGAQIYINSNYSISGSASAHIDAYALGSVQFSNITVTISGTPAFSNAFVAANDLGYIGTTGVTYSGSATGYRYSASRNAVIETYGGGSSYFPGNSSGSTGTGGVYD